MQETEKQTALRRKLKGVVVSNKMQKTLVVEVKRLVAHPVYKKRYTISKRYKAHYDEGEFQLGERVEISQTRPLSKQTRWVVVRKMDGAGMPRVEQEAQTI
jgi:small subunit ribosomal protein S17